ncbi:MAG: hypothetical protein J0L63_12165 [Anaerolineae bacterium]|nr:hypothetical protein [Anaerolineae bacterium]
MRVPRRTNFLWGVVLLALAIILFLHALGLIPVGIMDLINRSWPVLLVFAGLSIVLRDRVRFGSLLALLLSAGLVFVLATSAFSSRIGQQREDYRLTVTETVSPQVNLLRVSLRTLATNVEIVRSLDSRAIAGEFVGSTESVLQTEYTESGENTADLTITEQQPNQFPLLEAVGRGRFRLELPAGLPLDVSFIGADGTLTLNMSDLSLERLNVDLASGSAVITLPEYQPLGSSGDALLGTFVARSGSLTVRVPSAVAARFQLNRGGGGFEPVYDSLVYNYLVGDILEARNFDGAPIQIRYGITVPRGVITVESTAS